MKKKINNYKLVFDSIVYILSHGTKLQLFWSQLKANDVLPGVPILYYLKYNNYFVLKKFKMFNSNALMISYYDMWPNVNMPCGTKNNLIKNN